MKSAIVAVPLLRAVAALGEVIRYTPDAPIAVELAASAFGAGGWVGGRGVGGVLTGRKGWC